MPQPGLTTPDNDALPWQTTLLLALQHVLVVAATPITSVFLIAKALHFTDTVTASVLSATFLMCGLGAILQSLGVKGVGARLPFIMVPGGAPIAIFVAIAFTDQYPDRDWRRNSDLAVLLYRVADFPPLPAPFSPLYHRHHAANGVD